MDAIQWASLAKQDKYQAKALANRNVRTGPVRLSFANLFKPVHFKDNPENPARHGTTLLLPPGEQCKPLIAACAEVVRDQFGADATITAPSGGKVLVSKGGKRVASLDWPLRDQGDEGYEGYIAGSLCLSAYSPADQPPKVVDPRLQTITDSRRVYSGCYVFGTVQPYWSKKWERLAIQLVGVQFIADGDRLGGAAQLKTEEAFEDVGDEFAGADALELI